MGARICPASISSLTDYNRFNIAPFQNGVMNWTRTISPTLVNEARVGVNNIMLNNGGEDKGLGNVASSWVCRTSEPDCFPCTDADSE